DLDGLGRVRAEAGEAQRGDRGGRGEGLERQATRLGGVRRHGASPVIRWAPYGAYEPLPLGPMPCSAVARDPRDNPGSGLYARWRTGERRPRATAGDHGMSLL